MIYPNGVNTWNSQKCYPCDTSLNFIEDGSMSMFEKLCYIIELFKNDIEITDELIEKVNLKEDSLNITNARLLDDNGNFTGSWNGVFYNELNVRLENSEIQIANNVDNIEYITEQFEDGATGIVIDCGFFEDGDIVKNYDGGVF